MGILDPKPITKAAADAAYATPASVATQTAGKANTADMPPLIEDMIARAVARALITGGAYRQALGKFRNRLGKRDTEPVAMVFAGSSSTLGTHASIPSKRYVNRISAAMQAAFPQTAGTAPVPVKVLATAAGTTLPNGVQVINAGDGGTTSSNFLSTTTQNQIIALNPALIQIMVGSNDYSGNIDPATYKTNVQAKITALKTGITTPFTIVLVHSYPRTDVTGTYAWPLYGQALREIAAADPETVAFVDLSSDFALMGWPGPDPLDMMYIDNVHQTDAGHAYMADLLDKVYGVPYVESTLTTATRAWTTYTSDAFTGGDVTTLAGRTTDATLGGAGVALVGTSVMASWGITGGKLVPGSTPSGAFVGVVSPTADQRISFTFNSQSASEINLTVRRASTSASNAYRAKIDSGTVSLTKTISSVTTDIGGGSAYIVDGDKVTLQVIGGEQAIYINDVLAISAKDTSITAAGHAGIAMLNTSVFAMDNMIVERG